MDSLITVHTQKVHSGRRRCASHVAAEHIRPFTHGKTLEIFSSRVNRALESADLLRAYSAQPRSILLDPRLDAPTSTQMGSQTAMENLPIGKGSLEQSTSRTVFDSGRHFERSLLSCTSLGAPHSRHREFREGGILPDVVVNVSHYEVLYPLIKPFGFPPEATLSYAKSSE